MNRFLAVIACVATTSLVAGCGGDGDATTPGTDGETVTALETAPDGAAKEEPDAEAKGDSAAKGETVELDDSEFGEMLFDEKGQALYLFTADKQDESVCSGECAEAWPPFLTKGEPQAGSGVDQELLGTIERDDGGTQVTYDGQPLYTYANEGPGEVLCHNVVSFDGTWLVVGADGKALD